MDRPGKDDSGRQDDAAATGLVTRGNGAGDSFRTVFFAIRHGAVAGDLEIAIRKGRRFDACADGGCLLPGVAGDR